MHAQCLRNYCMPSGTQDCVHCCRNGVELDPPLPPLFPLCRHNHRHRPLTCSTKWAVSSKMSHDQWSAMSYHWCALTQMQVNSTRQDCMNSTAVPQQLPDYAEQKLQGRMYAPPDNAQTAEVKSPNTYDHFTSFALLLH